MAVQSDMQAFYSIPPKFSNQPLLEAFPEKVPLGAIGPKLCSWIILGSFVVGIGVTTTCATQSWSTALSYHFCSARLTHACT